MSKREALIQTLLGSFSLVRQPDQKAKLSPIAARLKAEVSKPTMARRGIAIAA